MISIVLMLSLLVCSAAAGNQNSLHKSTLFLHSFFKTRHWTITRDTVSYTLPQSFTALTPLRVSMTGTEKVNAMAFSTATGIYFTTVTVQPTEPLISKTKITVGEPVASPLGNSDSLFTLFTRVAANPCDTVLFAQRVAQSKVAVHALVPPGFVVVKSDTLTVSLPSSTTIITGLYGAPTSQNQTRVWVYGSTGMIRHFTRSGSGWTSETRADIAATETITAFCPELIGTSSGTLYVANGTSFKNAAQNSQSPVCAVTPTAALGSSGAVTQKNDLNGWQNFNAIVPQGNYLLFHFVPRTLGTGIELLDRNWQYTTAIVSDTPTVMTIYPTKVNDVLKTGGTYLFEKLSAESISIQLVDRDGNYLLPSMILNNSTNLFTNGTTTLASSHPDTACVPGFTELAGSTLTMLLRSDKIIFSAPSRRAYYDAITSSYSWFHEPFTTSYPWYSGSDLVIRLNNQRLTIRHAFNTTALELQPQTRLHLPLVSIIGRPGNRKLVINTTTIRSLRLYTAGGRVIADLNDLDPQSREVTLPVSIASGMLFVEYRTHDNRSASTILTIIR